VLFGTLHVRPGPAAVPTAFSHSAQLALLANLGFVVLARSWCWPCPGVSRGPRARPP